jgi:lauroyl/myristoyl acyltransferase
MVMSDNQEKRLADCLSTVRELEEENQQLRESAVTIRELAERLSEGSAGTVAPESEHTAELREDSIAETVARGGDDGGPCRGS